MIQPCRVWERNARRNEDMLWTGYCWRSTLLTVLYITLQKRPNEFAGGMLIAPDDDDDDDNGDGDADVDADVNTDPAANIVARSQ